MPVELMQYLQDFGLFGVGVLFYWSLSTGRLYLPREVKFIITQKDDIITDLRLRLQRADSEIDAQRGLMHKVVDQALEAPKKGEK